MPGDDQPTADRGPSDAGPADPTQTADTSDVVSAPAPAGGERIGPYRLLSVIGEGGFGVVWEADQTEPVRRRVAVKVIKPGMDSKAVVARFEAERQALAVMDHPCIAKVLDGGTTPRDQGSRPYFVMELVRGEPITEFCDKHKLDLDTRVELFVRVCEAVQHAHTKGVIHRDLKPSNILVQYQDGRPAPKVIDFGVAKALNQRLTEQTIFTDRGQMIGTPEYMSPEQAEMSGLDIDTRSDVYSLGVVLYELLTGALPFDPKTLRAAGFAEIQRIIREVEPPKPSTRLGPKSGSPAPVDRGPVNKEAAGRTLRHDLDWVVMKCLEKDRERRYETVTLLGKELKRFLGGEPVEAGAPSVLYRMRMSVRRHRLPIAASAVVVLALLAGTTAATLGLVSALQSQAKSEQELIRATETKRLLTEILQGVTPAEARGVDTTLLQGILEDASSRLSSGEITDQLVEAEMHSIVGEVYVALGMFEDADRHLPVALHIYTRILGETEPRSIRAALAVAHLYDARGLREEAIRRYEEAIELCITRFGEDHTETATARLGLARTLNNATRYTEAEPFHRDAVMFFEKALGASDPQTLHAKSGLATLYNNLGRYSEGRLLAQEVLDALTATLGADHPETLWAQHSLATLMMNTGDHAEAQALYSKTVRDSVRVLGEDHPNTLWSMQQLANRYTDIGEFKRANELHQRTLDVRLSSLGPGHVDTLWSMHNVANVYFAEGRFERAEPLYADALVGRARELGAKHGFTLSTATALADVLLRTDRATESVKLLEPALEVFLGSFGEGYPNSFRAWQVLSAALRSVGRTGDATKIDAAFTAAALAAAGKGMVDARRLNGAAWCMLTDSAPSPDAARHALALAEQACELELSDNGDALWAYMDTLALAQHATGDSALAARTQQRAIELMPSDADPTLHERLTLYKAESNAELGEGTPNPRR